MSLCSVLQTFNNVAKTSKVKIERERYRDLSTKFLGCTVKNTSTIGDETDIQQAQNAPKSLGTQAPPPKNQDPHLQDDLTPDFDVRCKAWTLRQTKKEHKLLVTERKMLRKILGPVKRKVGF